MIVLGIDAAWTATRPSGVALVADNRLLALAPSYASFIAGVDWRSRPVGGLPDCHALIAACVAIAGAPPDVIAIDMPLSTQPIVGRRAADNAIASALGRYGLGVHTPSIERPGPIADIMRAGFEAHGYRLATSAGSQARRKRTTLGKWRAIRRAMKIDGFDLRLRASKRYEDALDAVVCAWIGREFLAGRAKPYGDDTAAVWAW